MSHRARSPVWEVDGGTVVRCKVNGLEPPSGSGARRSETLGPLYLAFPPIDLETSMLGILGSLGQSTEKDEKTEKAADRSDNRSTERREFRQSLTLTIFDALVLLIVATGGVADGRARFATLVVGAAILDGGTALLAAIGPPWIQAGDRGADREHRHGQQSDRRDHLGAVATFDQRRCWNATFCIAVIPVLEKKAHALAIQRRTKRYRCVDHAKETAAKLWPREVTRYERNERNAET